MAGSLNQVELIGNLGDDPEVRNLQSGNAVANLSIATSESWKDKQTGEKKEVTQWHRVVVWNDNIIEVIEKYLKKGSKVYVRGQLQTRKWQDQDGNDRYSTEVVLTGFDAKLILLGDPRGGGDQNGNASRPGNNSGSRDGGSRYRDQSGGREENQDRGRQDQRGNFSGGYSNDMDDDIPF